MDIKIYNEDVYYYTNIVSEEDKNFVLSTLEDDNGWVRVYNDGHKYNPDRDPLDPRIQTCMLASRKYLNSEESTDADRKMMEIFNGVFQKTAAHYAEAMSINHGRKMPPIFVVDKHDEGTTYAPHVDSAPLGFESYTVLLYPNDAYDGGEISFVYPEKLIGRRMDNGTINLEIWGLLPPNHEMNSILDFWIKPEAMSVLIFPPLKPYAHAAHEVTNGTKYIIKGYWQVTDEDANVWSSSPYEGRSEENIKETNPEGFTQNGYEHTLIRSGVELVPEEYKSTILNADSF